MPTRERKEREAKREATRAKAQGLDELRAVRVERERLKLDAEKLALAHPAEPPRGEAELLEALATATDPRAIARASAQLAARRVAASKGAGSVEDLKKALEELRRCEMGYLELERERGELVERGVAKAVVGAFARRFILALERLESRAASQVELWLADDAFKGSTVDERGRAVRAWVKKQTSQARLSESSEEARAEIESLVANEVADREGT